jgi:sulfatase modifying factor 1
MIDLVRVPDTNGTPYLFGEEPYQRPINVRDFLISSTPVTQALWIQVMGSNPAERQELNAPVENVSWNDITGFDGFLDRINSSEILASAAHGDRALRFRLPSETEWEYAARGGPRWTDGFMFSGSNDVDAVAWYGPRRSRARRLLWRLLGKDHRGNTTRTHPVAQKAPNQLGIYDMSGNVWEWCADPCVTLDRVPCDGTPAMATSDMRRLRGGCHHNWPVHCSVSWRYGIEPRAHDGCIGFRLVLADH